MQKDIMKEMKKEDKSVKKAMSDLHSTEKHVDRADKSAQKIAGKVRKMDSKEIQAQKNVNKQNELYREAMSEHDKTKTQKEELERQYNNDLENARQLKEELQLKRAKLDEMIQAQKGHNEERSSNLSDIKGGFLPGSAPGSGSEGSGNSALGSGGPPTQSPTQANVPLANNGSHGAPMTGGSEGAPVAGGPQAPIGDSMPGAGAPMQGSQMPAGGAMPGSEAPQGLASGAPAPGPQGSGAVPTGVMPGEYGSGHAPGIQGSTSESGRPIQGMA